MTSLSTDITQDSRWTSSSPSPPRLQRRPVRADRAAAPHADARGGGAAAKGDAVVFAVNSRPITGARGDFRVKLRHGVSEITQGRRQTLGIIFHDAG